MICLLLDWMRVSIWSFIFLRQSNQLICHFPHHLIGDSIHGFGLDAGVNLVVDVIHSDEVFVCQRNFGGEPVEAADGGDASGDVVKGEEVVAVFFGRGDNREDVREGMPPAGIGLAGGVEHAEPGGTSVNGARRDGGLKQVFLFGEFHAGAQDLLEGGSAEDDAGASSAVRWFDDELTPKRGQIHVSKDGLFEKGRKDDGVGGVNARADEFEVHGGFVFRPGGKFGRVDAAFMVFPCPVVDGQEAVVALRTVEQGVKGTFAGVEGMDGFEQVFGRDLPEGQPVFMAGLFDEADEVNIVFPVPGEAEVGVHEDIVREEGKRKGGKG